MKWIEGLSEPGAHNLLILGAKLDQLSTNNRSGGCGCVAISTRTVYSGTYLVVVDE